MLILENQIKYYGGMYGLKNIYYASPKKRLTKDRENDTMYVQGKNKQHLLKLLGGYQKS